MRRIPRGWDLGEQGAGDSGEQKGAESKARGNEACCGSTRAVWEAFCYCVRAARTARVASGTSRHAANNERGEDAGVSGDGRVVQDLLNTIPNG